MTDKTQEQLIRNALADLDAIEQTMGVAASKGARAKPTVAELNSISDRIANARAFLKAALLPPEQRWSKLTWADARTTATTVALVLGFDLVKRFEDLPAGFRHSFEAAWKGGYFDAGKTIGDYRVAYARYLDDVADATDA